MVSMKEMAVGLGEVPEDSNYGDLTTAEILDMFEDAPVDKAVEMYRSTYKNPESVIGKLIRVVLNRSERINEIKQIIPEMFI